VLRGMARRARVSHLAWPTEPSSAPASRTSKPYRCNVFCNTTALLLAQFDYCCPTRRMGTSGKTEVTGRTRGTPGFPLRVRNDCGHAADLGL
jgi:hypothetical protein